ncbi:MAG TPA: tetratricopeptide repeat protein [Candidatus Obscuribacterales bacterium]
MKTSACFIGNAVCALLAVAFLNAAGEYGVTPAPAPPVHASRSPSTAYSVPANPATRPHVSKLKGRVEKTDIINSDWQSIYAEADALYKSGKYDEACKRWAVCEKSVEVQKPWTKLSGAPLIELAKKLATMYKTQSKPTDAARMYDMALSEAIKTYGKESLPVAQMMLEQGRMYTFYDGLKNFARADELLAESLRINEKKFGRFSIPAGDVDMIIAQLREKQARYGEALGIWQLIIDIGDRFEPNAISCCRIGPRQGKARCLEKLGRWDDAGNAHRELIAMCERGAHDMLPTVRSAYADCLMKVGKPEESARVYAEARAVTR